MNTVEKPDPTGLFTLPKGTILIGLDWKGLATFQLIEDTVGHAPELAAHGGVEGYEKWFNQTVLNSSHDESESKAEATHVALHQEYRTPQDPR